MCSHVPHSLPFCFPQQIKAVERYMRRLEFHISKVTSTPSMSYIRKNKPWAYYCPLPPPSREVDLTKPLPHSVFLL